MSTRPVPTESDVLDWFDTLVGHGAMTTLGGFMHLTGDGDRPPLRVSMPQFYQHGSAAGAAAAMIAHTHRQLTGEGQHVDVSCQQAVARTLAHAPQYWDLEQTILRRMGAYRESAGGTYTPHQLAGCQDGYVNFQPGGGTAGSARSVRALLEWMTQEGMGSPELDAVNWGRPGLRHRPRRNHGADRRRCRSLLYDPHPQRTGRRRTGLRRILLFPVSHAVPTSWPTASWPPATTTTASSTTTSAIDRHLPRPLRQGVHAPTPAASESAAAPPTLGEHNGPKSSAASWASTLPTATSPDGLGLNLE